jgi:hypothetical protein
MDILAQKSMNFDELDDFGSIIVVLRPIDRDVAREFLSRLFGSQRRLSWQVDIAIIFSGVITS